MSYLVQMLGLTHPELPLGGDRHRARRRADPRLRARVGATPSATSGSISPAARSTSCCRSASSSRCSSSGRACRRRSAPMSRRRRSKAPSRPSRSGPVASQIAIKMLGTNGGGFFNANAAHPFENPTALSNFVQMISIFAHRRGAHQRLRPHGRQPAPGLGDPRRRWACCSSPASSSAYWAEAHGNDAFTALGLTGGNMEGKEVRFGIVASALFAVITTAASCGAVNAMHDCFTALGGMIPLINMQLGEIIVGGVGAGLYGMLLFVIIAIFVAGLMVGRTPEYVGKKIEAKEVKMAMLAILILPLMYLGWTAVAVVYPPAVASIANPGPHGFSEVLYAFTSQTANNGSAFGGLTGNTLFYNITGAIAMLVGRFWMIIPAMAIAGSLAAKKIGAAVGRHLPDHGRPVRRPAGRRDPDRRRPHLLPGARARPDRRASRDDAPARCSQRIDPESRPWKPPHIRKQHAGLGAARSQDRRAGDRLGLRQARSADADQEPGDVRARGRHGPDHGHPGPRPRHRRRESRLRRSRSSSGCGSPCCSPTSPKRSPKAAARRRPMRCGRRAPRRRPSC